MGHATGVSGALFGKAMEYSGLATSLWGCQQTQLEHLGERLASFCTWARGDGKQEENVAAFAKYGGVGGKQISG